jgi:hypothetical protein
MRINSLYFYKFKLIENKIKKKQQNYKLNI